MKLLIEDAENDSVHVEFEGTAGELFSGLAHGIVSVSETLNVPTTDIMATLILMLSQANIEQVTSTQEETNEKTDNQETEEIAGN